MHTRWRASRTGAKALLSRAALERLMACESGGVLLRALNELGWGEAGDVDALAQRALNEACAFVRAVTPDANATDCFLAKYDVLNLKTLVKARALRMEDVPLSPNGALPVQVLRTALEGEKYEALPEAYRAALEEIARECALAMDPLLCDALLDRALFREIARRLTSVREKEIHACFAARAIPPMRSALRYAPRQDATRRSPAAFLCRAGSCRPANSRHRRAPGLRSAGKRYALRAVRVARPGDIRKRAGVWPRLKSRWTMRNQPYARAPV